MHNRIRVTSDENIVTNANIEVWDEKAKEWIDVRSAIRKAVTVLEVGRVSEVHLDLVMAEVKTEGVDIQVNHKILHATVNVLQAMGYVVVPRWDATADYFIRRAKALGMGYDATWELWQTSHPTASVAAFESLWRADT